MFTGIITHQGQIASLGEVGNGARLVVTTPPDFMQSVVAGASIAVNGVCLTAIDLTADSFAADLSLETLRRTTFAQRRSGDQVNLEHSLRMGDTLGGHLVLGHVDGVGKVAAITPHGESVQMRFTMPGQLAPLIAHKGCVAVDGISLTPTEVDADAFDVWLIPETLRRTSLGVARVGTGVNLEADLLSRYVARQLASGRESR